MKNQRSIFIAIAWLLAAVCLLYCVSGALPMHSLDHTCTGEDCLVCLCISLREALATMSVLLAGLYFTVCFVRSYVHRGYTLLSPRRWTPVCLKVKLSN